MINTEQNEFFRRDLWMSTHKQCLNNGFHGQQAIKDSNSAVAAFDKFFDGNNHKVFTVDVTGLHSDAVTKSIVDGFNKKHATLEFDGGGQTGFSKFAYDYCQTGTYNQQLAAWVHSNGLATLSAKRLCQTFNENQIRTVKNAVWTVRNTQNFISRFL